MNSIYSKIKNLEIGKSINLSPNGYVKRKRRNDYVLIDRDNAHRSRWGTAKEITHDAKYYIENGHLPPSEKRYF